MDIFTWTADNRFDDGDELWIDNCTIANNTEGEDSRYLIDSAATYLQIANSIIHDSGAQVLSWSGNQPTAQYDLVNNASTLPGGTGVMQGAPRFVDAANGDYHLLPGSPGVDYAPAQSLADLDGKPRTVDLPDVPNRYGPMDLGAYELQSDVCSASDTIFCNGFDHTQQV